jgi:hypothetical protein
MAKKPITKPAIKAAPAKNVVTSTAVRNSPIPKAAPLTPARKEVTYEMISQRAYLIHLSGNGGGEVDNWLRAERELKGL